METDEMINETVTYDKLPEAVAYMIKEMARMSDMIMELQLPKADKKIPIGIDEACLIVRKAKPTIYNLARRKLIPCYKNGNKYYFYEEELLEWIEKGRQNTIASVKDEVEEFIARKVRHKPKQRFGFM